MLRVVPDSAFSRQFTVYGGDFAVGLDMGVGLLLGARSRSAGTIEDIHYNFYREGRWRGAFILEVDGKRLVQAKRNIFSNSLYKFDYDDKHYVLKEKFLRRVLLRADQKIGLLYNSPFFSRKMTADLPEELPLVVRVFIIWLVLWDLRFGTTA